MEPGDRIVFYLTRIGRFAGSVRISGELFEDRIPVWPGKPGDPDPYPWRFATEPEVVLDEDEWVSAEEMRDLEHMRKWPPEHWKLAFQGQLRTVTEATPSCSWTACERRPASSHERGPGPGRAHARAGPFAAGGRARARRRGPRRRELACAEPGPAARRHRRDRAARLDAPALVPGDRLRRRPRAPGVARRLQERLPGLLVRRGGDLRRRRRRARAPLRARAAQGVPPARRRRHGDHGRRAVGHVPDLLPPARQARRPPRGPDQHLGRRRVGHLHRLPARRAARRRRLPDPRRAHARAGRRRRPAAAAPAAAREPDPEPDPVPPQTAAHDGRTATPRRPSRPATTAGARRA